MKTNNIVPKFKINPGDLLGVLSESPIVIAYVGPKTDESSALLRHFAEKHRPYLRAVRINPTTIQMTAWTSVWIRAQRAQLGWSNADDVPPGYYLFVGGMLKRYESGEIDPGDRVYMASGLLLHAVAVIAAPDGDALPADFGRVLGGFARICMMFGTEVETALAPLRVFFAKSAPVTAS